MSADAGVLARLPVAAPAHHGAGGVSRLARLVLADVRDRTRRPGYLVSLLAMLWLGQHMLPPTGAAYRTFSMDDIYRPVYNAAWVGTVTAMLTGVWFLFVGFYLVKGSVERDRRTGVGQVLAATRMSSLAYLWARTLGNVAVFATLAIMVAVAAALQQQLLGEDRRVDLAATLLPFLTITAPMALFAAASAVLFDCVRWLRGGLGNFAWFFVLPMIMVWSHADDPRGTIWSDLTGSRVVVEDVRRVMIAAHPDAAARPPSLSMGVNFSKRFREQPVIPFAWPGIRWNAASAASRLPWVLLSALVVCAAVVPFDRFDEPPRPAAAAGSRFGWPGKSSRAPSLPRPISPAALTVAPRGSGVFGIVRVELALLLKGQSPWWYAGLLALLIAELAAPLQAVREVVLPLASIWPALVWSALGHREQGHATGGVLFSCPRPSVRLLPAGWLAGALVMLVAGAPAVLRLLLAGETPAVLGWLLAAALIPALALACGVWTGSAKFFEVVYLFLWYVGPMHRVAELDYTGVTTPRGATLWLIYGATCVGLFFLVWSGRSRQMRS
jgi:hypothetical protein